MGQKLALCTKHGEVSGSQTAIFQWSSSGISFAALPHMIFITVYIVMNIALASSAWTNAGTGGVISALTIGVIAFCSGAGFRGSLYYGWQQISTAATAIMACMGIATWIGAGFSAELFGIALSGSIWAWLGFFASFVVNPGHSRRWTALKCI